MTVKDVAALIQVKEKTIYQWAELNKIPHRKLNGCLRFEVNEVYQWVDACRRPYGNCYNATAQTSIRCPKEGG